MLRQQVKHARFHQAVDIARSGGILQLGNTLPHLNTMANAKILDNLEMYTTEAGLYASFQYQKESLSAIIPYGNIIVMTLKESLKKDK